jgi:signal transduction histidine kinase
MNAIKFTPDGGSVKVSGKYLNGSVPAQVEVAIRDTGIGIDPASHQLIFNKFYQTGEVLLHSSGKTKFKGGGPGLGLAIARGIVEAHGGRIWVVSGYGKKVRRAAHYISLPRAESGVSPC